MLAFFYLLPWMKEFKGNRLDLLFSIDGTMWKRETPPVSPGEKRRSFWFIRDWKFTPSLSEGSRCSSPDIEVRVKSAFGSINLFLNLGFIKY